MLRFFYSLGIHLLGLTLKVVALFNKKIKLGVKGRQLTFDRLRQSTSEEDQTIWMHCASLGEYEQGLPVIQALKNKYPNHKIVVSFFSPSGYEVKKNARDIDLAVYIPLDTAKNAKRFLDILHPELILFVKYEIWPNMLLEAKKRQIKTLLISATFRKNQSYFKWYGTLMRKVLFSFNHIFTQDVHSRNLIEKLSYKAVSVSGDTRFDRVSNQLKTDNSIDFIENFKANKTTVVFGSSWPADDNLFIPFINKTQSDLKFIIAPHNIKPSYINTIEKQLKVPSVRFSDMEGKTLSEYKVFILDTIGYLSKAYSYADIAYVGGAAGQTGLHNVLEAAVFGVPILIGKNYSKFPEAQQLVKIGGITSVKTRQEFNTTILELINDTSQRSKKGQINASFIKNNRGAVVHILDYIRI